MARKSKKKAIKINITEGADQVPVRVIRHTSVREAVIMLYGEMSKAEVKKAYQQVKKCWRAEKWQMFYEKIANKYFKKLTNNLKGE